MQSNEVIQWHEKNKKEEKSIAVSVGALKILLSA